MGDVGELPVEVRNRFDGSWSGGFVIADTVTTDDGPRYRIRRLSDGTVLWGLFAPDELVLDLDDPDAD